MSKLIILDRDGVINHDSDNYIRTVDEWIPLPGSAEAIARLSKAGYTIAVATNQSGLARGYFSEETLHAMHQKMQDLVSSEGGKIDCIKYCPHGPDDQCNCRKPLPGLIEQISETLGLPAESSWMVGDSLRDLQAGQAMGCNVALVKTGKGVRTLNKGEGLNGVPVFEDLAAFTNFILNEPS
ncbi:D-glycero-beta-D-manno-heptose 1,7-bisphosphate 7-phosphatase [Endozoicomonas arenosclerae]|uniref:D-glycero-beta-D-manno-heptose 1,7-bisphosphate 7-phosphatase n=1 Tax=Endozoicomonas arenosclerae TaxID=1633495 RepID=UPI0007811BF8|nr:D-glycero-beta-D-manno-heptose 1,7-bisphosphate 7-phosphatase [Endozoicomonas arenosclerae]